MNCKMFLAFLAVLLFALTATTSQAVTLDADGFITDGGNPPVAVPLDGYVDFATISASSSQQDSDFNGSAAKPIATVRDWIMAIGKMLLDMPCSTDPEPDESGKPLTLATITNETYEGVFSVVSPDVQASGSFSRTPALFDFNYDLMIGAGLPELTGFYTFDTDTLPAGLGSAVQSTIFRAETVAGGFYEFTQNTTLTFDSMVELSAPQISVGSETITIVGDEVNYAGSVQVTLVPEPSSLVLLIVMAGGILAYACRYRRRKINVLLALLLVAAISPPAADASIVNLNATGQVTENGSGATGQHTLSGSVDFSTTSSSSTSQSSSYGGQATQDMEIGLREAYARAWMAIKNILNYEISTTPTPDGAGPDSLAALTGEMFDGVFVATTPDFSFSGSFSRTPTDMDILYNLTLESTCPDLTGYYTFEAYTTPNGLGSALRTIDISAEMVGGGFYEFTHDTVLTFDPSIEVMFETAVGWEYITRTDDNFDFIGEVDVTVIPEPSTFVLMVLGAAGLLAFARRR